MPAPSDILADRVSLRLRSIDRLYLNLYQPLLQSAGQLRRFPHDIRGHPVPSPALFERMTRDWVMRIERFATEQGLPLIRFQRGERKEERLRPLFEQAADREGVVAVGVAQERASSWWSSRARGADPGAFRRRTVSVLHHYVYLVDREWGPAFIKICSVRRGEASSIQRVEFPPRQGPASHREPSLAGREVTNVAKRRQGDGQAVTQVKRSSPVTLIKRMPTGCCSGKAIRGAGHGDRAGGSAGVRAHGMPGDGWVKELGKPTGVSPRGE